MAKPPASNAPAADGESPPPRSRAVGRPRSADADRRITEATLELLATIGYQGLSMEGVAAQAKVGKATVYRRHQGKAALVAAVLREAAGGSEDESVVDSVPDGRSTREALEEIQRDARQAMTNPGALAIISTLLGDEQRNPDLVEAIRSGVFAGRIAAVRRLMERGVAQGEVRESIAFETVAAVLFGSVVARTMLGAPLSDAWLRDVMDIIWAGVQRH